jgi:hypothetical protein
LSVDASTFSSNGSTDADGGALFNFGTVTLTASTLSSNGGPGAYGGAVRNDGLLTVQQCTFAGNRADLGGALYNVGTMILSSSTLSLNTSVGGGGGIENIGSLLARNTIVAGNTISTGSGRDLNGMLTSQGHNLFSSSAGGRGFVASDLLNVNPLLAPLRSNGGPTQTMALLPGSAAIAAGDPMDVPAYDQRGPGYPRILGGLIDIGAYEVQPGPAARLQVSAPLGVLQPGQSADIGFWNSPNGQDLINTFNGGPNATGMANWLAVSFPNLYGSAAGANNLFGKTNTQVAALYESLFNSSSLKLEAEVLATALNVYATTSSLGGTTAQTCGFNITAYGLGASSFNVGADGAAFGVPNNTVLNVYQLLMAANSCAVDGVLHNGDAVLRKEANDLFDALNTAGGIG